LVCNCIEESSGLIAYDALANMVSHQVAVYTDIDYPTIDDPSLVSPCNDGQADELNAFDDLLNLTTQNDGYVVTWYDQFGSNDATNSTAAEQPKIWDSTTGLLTEGGKPAIEFDGVDDSLATPDYIVELSQNNATVLSVTKADDSRYMLVEADAASPYSSNFILGDGDSSSILWVNTTEFGAQPPTTQTLLGFTYNGTNFQAYLNGSTSGSAGTALVNTEVLNKTVIGSRAEQSGDFYTGLIQEIITYKSDQTSNLTAIQNNINVYYVLYGLKHYRQRVLADSGTFALQGRDALVYNSVTISEMPSLICSCDAYKATKLYNINPA